MFLVHNIELGEGGYRFRKEFKGREIFEGQVLELLEGVHSDKNRRYVFVDDNKEDSSLTQISYLNKKLKINPVIKSTNIVQENNTSFNYHPSFIDEEDNEENEETLESDDFDLNLVENEILLNNDILIKISPKNKYQTSKKKYM